MGEIMIESEIEFNENKELHIESVQKYKKMSLLSTAAISTYIVGISVMAISFIFGREIGLPPIQENIENLAMMNISISPIIINAILDKVGYKRSIKEIEELFTEHRLVLKDEISNSKGRGK